MQLRFQANERNKKVLVLIIKSWLFGKGQGKYSPVIHTVKKWIKILDICYKLVTKALSSYQEVCNLLPIQALNYSITLVMSFRLWLLSFLPWLLQNVLIFAKALPINSTQESYQKEGSELTETFTDPQSHYKHVPYRQRQMAGFKKLKICLLEKVTPQVLQGTSWTTWSSSEPKYLQDFHRLPWISWTGINCSI